MTESIVANRVRLRPARGGDVDRFLDILRHPDVARWWGEFSPGEVRTELITESVFAVELDGGVIGLIQFYEEDDPQYRHAGIDITLHPDQHGKGLGAEAIRALARHLFEVRGHHRIVIDPAAHNVRAIRSYERVGFRRVGVMRRYERGTDGSWHDGLLMDLLREELIP